LQEGINPLLAACIGGHMEIVKALLAKGAEVNMMQNVSIMQSSEYECTLNE
jgi:ankyrin repeat protein